MYAIGMGLGGLVSSLGVPFALACDAASFLVAAGLLVTLPAMPTRGGGAWADAVRRSFATSWTGRSSRGRAGAVRGGRGEDATRACGRRRGRAAQRAGGPDGLAGTGATSLGLLQAIRGIGTGVGPLVAERAIAGGMGLGRAWAVAVLAALVGIGSLAVLGGSAVGMVAAGGGGGAWGRGRTGCSPPRRSRSERRTRRSAACRGSTCWRPSSRSACRRSRAGRWRTRRGCRDGGGGGDRGRWWRVAPGRLESRGADPARPEVEPTDQSVWNGPRACRRGRPGTRAARRSRTAPIAPENGLMPKSAW